MAAPALATVAKAVAKHLAVDAFSEPEKLMKYVGIFLIVILAIALLFVVPIILVINIPTILLNGFATDANILQKQKDIVAIYQNVPATVNQDVMSWINSEKNAYAYADDIVVNYDLNLDWKALISIDSVRYNQDFRKVKSADIAELANAFIKKVSYTETYPGVVVYKNPYTGVVTTNQVSKTRAVISVSTKDYSSMLDEFRFNDKQKQVANNMYNVISAK